jgi:transmembrane sensor
MTRNQFHLLLKRYLDGNASQDEINIVDTWYQLLDTESLELISTEEFDEIESRLWHTVQASTIYKPLYNKPSNNFFSNYNVKKLAVAATFLGLIIVSYFLFKNNYKKDETVFGNLSISGMLQMHNVSDTQMMVFLKDSSSVLLKPNATLYYPKQFLKDKREVYLEGEAFFKVAKNTKRPFYVYSGNIVTHVLGTSFWIKPSQKENQISVEVVTGRVEVYEHKQKNESIIAKNNGVVITPNQKVVYTGGDLGRFQTSLVESPKVLIIDESGGIATNNVKLVFDKETVEKVVKTMSRIYGVDILLENDNLMNIHFSGDISNLSMFQQLDIICKAIDARYELKETKILIKSNLN